MSFEATLAARAHKASQAQPTALFRHRAIAKKPLCIVAWQLGAEPYTVGAIALGDSPSMCELYVPGYPIDRDLLFAELTRFSAQFCPAFEAYAKGKRETIERYGEQLSVPMELPQIVVANGETIRLLGRLGRRLAYLPTDGEQPADPLLPRLGRHLMWIAEHALVPGQQLILSAADLLATHYATSMSPFESASLNALEAWVEPPKGLDGFRAAEIAETQAVGPAPTPSDAEHIFELMGEFNRLRAWGKDPAVVRKHIKPLRAAYAKLVDDTWALVWKVIARERKRPEAASVARRAREDRIAYAGHIAWMAGPAQGRRKTRRDARSAAMKLNEYERAHARLTAEEAIDDPLRMIPVLLQGQAIAGEVVSCNPNRRELINGRACKRPVVVLRTEERCVMPLGTEVWWTAVPNGREWLVEQVTPDGGGSRVSLILQTNRMPTAGLPQLRSRACFSELNTREPYEVHLPQTVPWTHRPNEVPSTDTHLDSNESDPVAA